MERQRSTCEATEILKQTTSHIYFSSNTSFTYACYESAVPCNWISELHLCLKMYSFIFMSLYFCIDFISLSLGLLTHLFSTLCQHVVLLAFRLYGTIQYVFLKMSIGIDPFSLTIYASSVFSFVSALILVYAVVPQTMRFPY